MSDNIIPPLDGSWKYEEIHTLDPGIIATKDSRYIPNNAFVNIENLNTIHGHLHIDNGFNTFANVLNGRPRLPRRFNKTDGTYELVLVTDNTFYKYNTVAEEWQYVSDSVSTTLNANGIGGTTSIGVTASAGFVIGKQIGIMLDSGSQHQAEITNIPGPNAIDFTPALPGVGTVATIGNAVIQAVELNGSNDYQVHCTTFPANDWFIFTNNVDNVKRYNGTDCVDVPNLPSAGNTQCQAVALYNNYLLLLNTTEGSAKKSQRIRWCDTGDPTNWSTGNAGYEDLYDSEDHIVTALELGSYLIVYRDKSIVRGVFNNTESEIFAFDPVISDHGAYGVWSVAKVKNYHIVVGNEEIYYYRGGLSVEEADENVHDLIFGVDGDFEGAQADKTVLMFSNFLETLWVMYPTIGSIFPNKILKFRPEEKGWTIRLLHDEYSCVEEFVTSSEPTWLDLDGTWDDQTWKWSDRASAASIPIFIVGTKAPGTSDYITAFYGLTTTTDFGDALSYIADTKDFGHHRYNIRFEYFDVYFDGTALNVYVSTDRGQTWTLMKQINEAQPARIYYDFVTHYARFRFQGLGGGIHIESFGFSWRIDSEN